MKKLFDSKGFKIFYTLFRICFILMIVVYLSFIVIQRLSGNKSIMGYRLFNVATGSMAGVYDVNDVIAVKDCDVKKLKVGDDIAYRGEKGGFEGLLVTHRIIKIEPTEDRGLMITTQGVKSSIADPKIGESQVLGKVVGVVPVISTLNHVVKSQLGFFLLVFLPLVLVITLEVLQTITDIKLEKNEIRKIDKNDDKEDKDIDKEDKKEEKVEKKDSKKEKKDSSKKDNNKEKKKDDKKENDSSDDKEENKDEKEESDDTPKIVGVINDDIEIL